MDTAWTFELLSNRGLSSSILLTVLVGLWVMLLCTETLGWIFVGVVVPGYLASVLVISPTSALAIFVEALVTFGLARLLAQGLGSRYAWSPFFGRDRFFLIVLLSLLVRQMDQTLVLPLVDLRLRAFGWQALSLSDQFSSIGLVLVPLTANFFWKQRLDRGLVQFGAVLGVTYILLRWVLLPYTNLTSGSLILLYEDAALNFVSNAKVYIVMISTAFLASVANLRYGWNFGGILIAALLALLWWTPQKVATTLLEAVFLYALARWLLKVPAIARINLEGSRKIVAMFSIAFVLKCMIAAAIGDAFVGLKVTDMFAFGYLMSSILAVRMLSEGSALRVLMPVLFTSILGLVLSSVLGLELQKAVDHVRAPTSEQVNANIASHRLLSSPSGVMAYASSARVVSARPDPDDRFLTKQNSIWRLLGRLAQSKDKSLFLHEIAEKTKEARMVWRPLNRKGVYLLHPGEDDKGSPYPGPMALFRDKGSGPILVVHGSRRHPGLADEAWRSCVVHRCRALVITHAPKNPQQAVDQTRRIAALGQLHPLWHVVADPKLSPGAAKLSGQWSAQAQRELKSASGLSVSSGSAVSVSVLGARMDFKEQDRVLSLASSGLLDAWVTRKSSQALTLESGSMAQVLRRWTKRHRHGARPREYSASELRLLQERIIAPLTQAVHHAKPPSVLLQSTAFWARLLQLNLILLPDCAKHGCVALVSGPGDEAFIWLLRFGASHRNDLQVPRPRYERGTLGFASQLWRAREFRSLLVHSGASHLDPARASGVGSLYHAVHQGVELAESRERSRGSNLVVIVRGAKGELFRDKPQGLGQDLVIGLGTPLRQASSPDSKLSPWLEPQGHFGFLQDFALSDASQESYRYSGQNQLQVRFTRHFGRKTPVVLWLSPSLRDRYQSAQLSSWLALDLQGRKLSLKEQAKDPLTLLPVIDEAQFLLDGADDQPLEQSLASLWSQDLDTLSTLAHSRSPQLYAELRRRKDLKFRLVQGRQSGRIYLSLTHPAQRGCLRALVRLGPHALENLRISPTKRARAATFARYQQRAPRILWAHGCSEKGNE